MIFKKCRESSLPLIRNLLADSFSNYFFPVNPTVEELKARLESLSVDYNNSLIMYVDNEPIGIAICGARGDTTHLGPMGIITKYQGQGYGKELLNNLIELHKQNNFKYLLLEVICQNINAYKLYKNIGFKTIRKLRGFKSFEKKLKFNPDIEIKQTSSVEALKYFDEFHKNECLSWQFAYETVDKSNCNFGFTAFEHGKALGYLLLKDARIADIGLADTENSFDAFKALINSAFEAGSFVFIFDLPEEDKKVKYFENIGFDTYFDQYEMIYNLTP